MQNNRVNEMVDKYGEVCTQTKAAKILNLNPRTVFSMLEDGRLSRVGHRVDVRSIANYIENAAALNEMTSQRKNHPRSNMSQNDFFRASRTGNWTPRR